ncbi:MAG: hypothetical protein DMF78_18595 [Acidobacteria bacterium]|nr:MAG: hypothetical protein DMF78_18595 [Acidobacteriota bacterium]
MRREALLLPLAFLILVPGPASVAADGASACRRPTSTRWPCNGRLVWDKPSGSATADHFRYDPDDPVPSVGGNNCCGTPTPAGPQDQRPIEARRDVTPGQVYRMEIDLVGTSVAFRKGHRLRVHVTSSHFPQFDRNPNTGAAFGRSDEVKVAEQTVYHDAEHPSHILLPVIPRRQR